MTKHRRFSGYYYMALGIYLLFLVVCLQSCSLFDYGSINHALKFTTETSDSIAYAPSLQKNISNNRYVGFGDYITSLTPSVFTASIHQMNYQDNWDLNDKSTHIISYVVGDDPEVALDSLYVDFSNNQEVSITPTLYSTDLHGNRIFRQKEVTFNYFNFCPSYLYLEVELPTQYTNITINEFANNTGKVGNMLKTKDNNLVSNIFSDRYPDSYVFGNTDSTFIFNKNGNLISPSENFPFGGSANGMIVRSSYYNAPTVTMPESEETITMYSTISFDIQDLIQVYAGNDNVPYTSDDIFVYAPNYWERIKVKLDIK